MFSRVGRAILGCSVAVGWLLGAAGCGGSTVTLGDRERGDAGAVGGAPSIDPTIDASTADTSVLDAPVADAPLVDVADGGWTPPLVTEIKLVQELAALGCALENPTLTDDLRLIFFSSPECGDGGTNSDIWFASRGSADATFGPAERIGALSTNLIEGSPAISDDGLKLWLSIKTDEPTSDADVGTTSDIWLSTRTSLTAEWPNPALVSDLSYPGFDDIPRPLGNHNLTMPLGSRRDGAHFLTYLATRSSTEEPFSAVRQASELDVDIDLATTNTADACLTQDGLTIYFVHATGGKGDIYVAHRATTDVPFERPKLLPGINNGVTDERDPWVNSKETVLYFTADWDGILKIYQAKLQP